MMSTFYVWDLLPILAIAALLVAFFVKNSRLKKEEKELTETLQTLQTAAGNKDEDTEL